MSAKEVRMPSWLLDMYEQLGPRAVTAVLDPATVAEQFYLWELELLTGDGRPVDEPRDKTGSAR